MLSGSASNMRPRRGDCQRSLRDSFATNIYQKVTQAMEAITAGSVFLCNYRCGELSENSSGSRKCYLCSNRPKKEPRSIDAARQTGRFRIAPGAIYSGVTIDLEFGHSTRWGRLDRPAYQLHGPYVAKHIQQRASSKDPLR